MPSRRISYRRRLTGAMMIAALMVNTPTATAQTFEQKSRIRTGIDEAIQAVDHLPSMKKMSPQEKRELVEFVVGKTLFVMAHEIGHVVINELDLPVLGREEDAADSFAIILALQLRSAFSERVLMEAAKGWLLSSYRDKKAKTALAFYGEHGVDLQRAYHVVCMMVGSDPDRFNALANEAKLPEWRQRSCVRDYRAAAWSWERVLKPHRRTADQPKVTIKVEYKDEEKFPVTTGILRHMGVLEAFADNAADRFAWPRPFSMEARACDEPNARWFFGTQTLVLCHELVGHFVELFQSYSRKLPARLRSKR
jgi:hypothetical protein